MSCLDTAQLQSELERSVLRRTNRRVRQLSIEVRPERIILRGRTSTYHVKQLAQHGILELVPHLPVENSIAVETKVEVFPGALLS